MGSENGLRDYESSYPTGHEQWPLFQSWDVILGQYWGNIKL